MTAREYFDEHVVIAIEVERADDHGREWYYEKGVDKAEQLIESVQEYGDYLSDFDYASKARQEPFIQRVLKLADLNFWKNPDWVLKNKLDSYDDVIYFILDNELYKA